VTVSQIAWRLWLPLAILVLWEGLVAAGQVNPLLFPAPSHIAAVGITLARSGRLWPHVSATLSRTISGFTEGAVLGITVGLLMGRSRRIRWSLEPLLSTLVSLPKLSLLPLLMLLLGTGEASRVVVVAAASFIVVALQTADAIASIDPDFVELARNYGARRIDLIQSVYVPATLPQLSTGLRLGLGRALGMTIAVEILGAPAGLGALIWAGWQTFRIEEIYIGVFIGAVFGAAFHLAMRGVERMLVPWQR
jgi:NitT/TauT family transport system permease protein